MRISDWSSDVCSSDLREIDFLTVGGASTRNVDAAAADIILGPGAALTIGFGHGVRDIFLVDLFLGDAGFGDRKSTRLKLQSLMRISYAVFCLKKKKKK